MTSMRRESCSVQKTRVLQRGANTSAVSCLANVPVSDPLSSAFSSSFPAPLEDDDDDDDDDEDDEDDEEGG